MAIRGRGNNLNLLALDKRVARIEEHLFGGGPGGPRGPGGPALRKLQSQIDRIRKELETINLEKATKDDLTELTKRIITIARDDEDDNNDEIVVGPITV